MNSDEPLALEPVRGPSPLVRTLLVAVIAFIAGVAGMAAFNWWTHSGTTTPSQPAPTPAAVQEQPATVRPLPPGTDVATLAAREQALAARLDLLDLRLRDTEGSARTASNYASQAERLLIAFASRRAIERGQALGPLEAQLRRRFGEAHGEAVSTVIQSAAQPVLLQDLRVALETIAPRLLVAPDAGPWTRFRAMIGDLVVLRRVDTPDPRASARLREAQRLLAAGNVEAALAEVARMPGAGDAENWVNNAKRYIAARSALNEIEQAAMDTTPAISRPAS